MFARQLVRNIATSAIRRSGEEVGGKPGHNLPFSIENRYKLTALVIAFFGSGLATPFLIVRHQMLK